MTTAVDKLDKRDKPPTLTQRANEAVQQAGAYLELPNRTALTAAMAQAALHELQRNPSFAVHVRALYEQFAPRPKTGSTTTKRVKRSESGQAAPDIELVPRMNVQPREANPGAAPDAYYLCELYGAEQLPTALARYKLPELKLAAELVQQRNPGTKPSSKSNRDALIAYIVGRVGN